VAGVKLTETTIPPNGSIAALAVCQQHITFMETPELNPGAIKTEKCHQDRRQVGGRYLGSSKRFLPVSLAFHKPNTPSRLIEVTEL